jgi:prolyl-tRNA synthetase
MRWSKAFIPTLKEAPREAELVSHKLMVRAGLIRKLAAGIYTYLPFGWRAVRKVEQIVREELDRVGCQEMLMPVLSPAELWRESGRWDVYGKELMRLRDRHEREFALGPTHEEIVTNHVRGEVVSRAADDAVPDSGEVSRRDPAAVRGDAWSRVQHDGRIQLPRRPRVDR